MKNWHPFSDTSITYFTTVMGQMVEHSNIHSLSNFQVSTNVLVYQTLVTMAITVKVYVLSN